MRRLTVTLPALHAGQRIVKADGARFRVLNCGRRWGKTALGVLECIEVALRGGRAWWVAPSYKMATPGWRGLAEIAHQIPGAAILKGERTVVMPSGGVVSVRSADDPASLRGEGLDFVVLDEAAYMAEEAWAESIRPALSDRNGRALIISTPNGRNWFWREYQRGLAGEDDYISHTFPTSANPYIPASEIDAARKQVPENIFRQEYLAEFLEDSGAVFRSIMGCVYSEAPPTEPERGHVYVMGADWAQVTDFTVFYVMDATTRRVVDGDRFNSLEWAIQRDRLQVMATKWKPRVILAEANSIGGPNIEALQRKGLPVKAFTTTAASKADAVQSLALAFEQGEIMIPNDPVLIGELQAFEATKRANGWTYSAPEGSHDDCVIALALAWQAGMEPRVASLKVDSVNWARGQDGQQPGNHRLTY